MINQGCIKFLIFHPLGPGGGGSLSNPLGKNFKLWRGEGNLRALGKDITWKKREGEVISSVYNITAVGFSGGEGKRNEIFLKIRVGKNIKL